LIIPDTFILDSGNFSVKAASSRKHEEPFIDMNELHRRASGRVQRTLPRVEGTIDEPAIRPEDSWSLSKEENTMLKTISAALLAVSVLAAPALAAGIGKTAQTPATKSAQLNKSVLGANAKMGRHHARHARHHHHHKKVMTQKVHSSPKAAAKRVPSPARHG
jgi:hypothetical protein